MTSSYWMLCPILYQKPRVRAGPSHFKNKQAGKFAFWSGVVVNTMQQEQQQQRSPYEVLGVGRFTTQKEIRKRYLQLCKTYHPDISANKKVDFTEITVAYEMLANNKHQQALDIKTHNYNHKPINTSLWTRRSYIVGFALVALTFAYAYESKPSSSRALLPHEKRRLASEAAAQSVPANATAASTALEEEQVKSNDVTPWQAAGTSYREWRKR